MSKIFSILTVLVAVFTATIPAAIAGGPNDGVDVYLAIKVVVNGKEAVRNVNTGKYFCHPGDILTFCLQFVANSKDGEIIVPSPVPFSAEISVGPKTTGVVSPYRGRAPKHQNAWLTRKSGYIYVNAHVDSESPGVEFTRLASETIVVSDKPAPVFSVELTYQPSADPNVHDGLVIMRFNSNVELTNGHIYVYSYNGKAYCGFTCDQGGTWDELTLDNNVSWTYISGTTSAYRWWTENGEIKSITTPLPDGIMGYQGIDLPMTIPGTISGSGFLIQTGVIPGKG